MIFESTDYIHFAMLPGRTGHGGTCNVVNAARDRNTECSDVLTVNEIHCQVWAK